MLFAIHSQNEEIIHSLEDKHGEFGVKTYKRFFYESLKCHHNDIANYFLSKLNEDDKNSQDTINQSLKYYNFKFLKNEFIKESSFFYLCKYDYCTFVDSLLKSQTLDVNKKEILRKFANSIFFFQYFEMKLFILFYKTALFAAVEKENIEIVKLLLTKDKLDINIINKVQNHVFQ